jgi:RHS repeat-associated protein
MVYPDGERVEFLYNSGGLLNSMRGEKQSSQYSYVRQLGYDKFEQRVFLAYGNGTRHTFSYEPDRRRLKNITARTTANRVFMDNGYSYDNTDNITSFRNNAPVPPANLMGGPSEYEFDYDDLYRITSAEGNFRGKNERHHYTLDMSYNSVGSILNKEQLHERGGSTFHTELKTTYNYDYAYATEQPHAPVHIGNHTYTYDANGNQTGWTDDTSGQRRRILWDEENSIRAIYDNGALYHYMYDASGERVLKGQGSGQWVYVNGALKGGNGQMGNYTVYVNPYIVLHSGGYTKHYYIENQRIVSKLGGGFDNNGQGPLKAGGNKVNYLAKYQQAIDGISTNLSLLGMNGQTVQSAKSVKAPPGQVSGNGNTSESFRFFYHHDHLGSTSYVTDASGEVYQHLEYFAFGETFVEEHSNTHRTPYLFSGKELDSETGLYYFGARYYDPRTSVWQSVDPLTDKYAALSPYQYAANNPMKYVDPDGRDLVIWYTESGKEKSYNFKGVADAKMPKNKFVEQVVEAYNYNVNNKGGDNLKKIATSTEVHVNVREQASPTPKEGELLQSDQKNIGNVYQGSTNTILWDPYGGLATDQAITLSPATGLEHEGDHAWKHMTDPEGYRKLVNTKDKAYTDAEEKRVIMGSELKTARNNGEMKKDQKVTRGSHGGFYVKTTGPTSTTGPKKKNKPGIIEELK